MIVGLGFMYLAPRKRMLYVSSCAWKAPCLVYCWWHFFHCEPLHCYVMASAANFAAWVTGGMGSCYDFVVGLPSLFWFSHDGLLQCSLQDLIVGYGMGGSANALWLAALTLVFIVTLSNCFKILCHFYYCWHALTCICAVGITQMLKSAQSNGRFHEV